ncbi:MAG: ion transporter [Nanoarchaeota archaeon]
MFWYFLIKSFWRKFVAYLETVLQNNTVILFLILVNALIIFVQEFGVEYHLLNAIEVLITVAFILEVYFKSKTRTFKVYISTGWNKLDFVLILISIPSLFSVVIFDLDILLVFRVFRIFKFFRIIQYFPMVNSVLPGVRRAIHSSYLVFFGFFTMLFIFSILSCAIFKNVAPEYFSNPIDSLFSTFRVFTVEGWSAIPDLIELRSGEAFAMFARIYFSLLMFFGGIIGLSIVNSIFVDAMVSDNHDDLRKEVKGLKDEILELKQIIKDKTLK